MELPANPMAYEITDDAVPMGLTVLLNRMADIAHPIPRYRKRDRFI